MAFGFDYEDSGHMIDGLKMLMKDIANNSESYTHKNVRALARSAIYGVDELSSLPDDLKAEIRFLLGCLSFGGLAHYDRVYLANHIRFLITQYQDEQTQLKQSPVFNEF